MVNVVGIQSKKFTLRIFFLFSKFFFINLPFINSLFIQGNVGNLVFRSAHLKLQYFSYLLDST